MAFWTKAEDQLEDILGHFHTIRDKLEVFIDRVNDTINGKRMKIVALKGEVDTHLKDLDQAVLVKENVKKLLGQS